MHFYGTFRRLNALSCFFILWLGVATNFSVFFCEFRPAGCWALKVHLVGGKYRRNAKKTPFKKQKKRQKK